MAMTENQQPEAHTLMKVLSGLFADVPTSQTGLADKLSALFIPRKISRGEPLVTEGAVWRQVYFIERGMLRLFYTSPDGKEFNKAFFTEGDLLWPTAPKARNEPSLFTIAALEDCRLFSADFRKFQDALRASGCWEHFALPFVERLADNKFLREYEFLVKDAQARFDAACAELGPLLHRIPDYQLASYIGVTNVTLSRIRQRRRTDHPV
jgi:CRP-like cAMP-binding protein